MPRRIQLMTPDEEFDRMISHFYDGMRGRIIRYLIQRACEAIEDEDNDIAVDDIIRGDFRVQSKDYGNF